jgi:hypothetical protein
MPNGYIALLPKHIGMTFESYKRSFGFPCPYPVGDQNFNNRELILQLMQGFPYPFFSVGDALRYIYYTLDCRFSSIHQSL